MASSRFQFRLLWVCVLMTVAAVFVVARMAWVTSRTMTGWKTVGRHLADATVAPFGRRRVIVPIASPRKQAELILFVLPATALLVCRIGKYQFSLRTLMGFIGAFAVLLLIPAYGRWHWDVFNTFPPAFSVPERGWNGFIPGVCRNAVLASKGSWEWAMWQWIAYSGLEISVIASLLSVGLWSALRWRRRNVVDSAPGSNERTRVPFAAAVCCVSRSALAIACALALVYLAMLPTVLNTIDDDYRSRTGYWSHPLQGWEDVEAANASVESDPAAMQRLRGFVDGEMGESDSPNAE